MSFERTSVTLRGLRGGGGFFGVIGDTVVVGFVAVVEFEFAKVGVGQATRVKLVNAIFWIAARRSEDLERADGILSGW